MSEDKIDTPVECNVHESLFHIQIHDLDIPQKNMDALKASLSECFKRVMPGHGVIVTDSRVVISRIV